MAMVGLSGPLPVLPLFDMTLGTCISLANSNKQCGKEDDAYKSDEFSRHVAAS